MQTEFLPDLKVGLLEAKVPRSWSLVACPVVLARARVGVPAAGVVYHFTSSLISFGFGTSIASMFNITSLPRGTLLSVTLVSHVSS